MIIKERPILFNGAMVRAILAGTKTQTRRVVKTEITPTPARIESSGRGWGNVPPHVYIPTSNSGKVFMFTPQIIECPHGKPGDRLWVRETWKPRPNTAGVELRGPDDEGAIYRATWDKSGGHHWKPSIHMPRWACRIVLEITEVRVERLRDIRAADVIAEGAWPAEYTCADNNWQQAWIDLWDGIYSESSPWSSNPWVWVLEFRRVGQ